MTEVEIIAEVARGLADAADDGCFDNPPCCDEPPCSDSCSTDLDEWHSGEEDREWWTKLARAGVSRLRDAGHPIVPSVEPTPDPDCGQVWLAGTRSDGFHLTTEPGRIWDFGGNEYTVDEARSYAAAMLSAAAAASPTAQEES
ncbi:hypothetical protein DK926_18760 [Rhodococcus sp. Eu-32]|uniref:hypothetical protein n=1 Tax=Rhodococcus sp. Eu-32 TaxID=1017319 RepID=UPI000DF2B54D|nr:hypothetical protein [Rhodococcus sp. Eu-32]RRQ26289.1 hypothetical protein DK926_18760 [Rhodococcus sp. Eu-32]